MEPELIISVVLRSRIGSDTRVCERGLVVLKVWERFTVLTNEPLLGHAAENGKVKKW